VTRLAVWLDRTVIGHLSSRRGGLEFEYTAEALGHDVGRPLLSVAMPTRTRPYRGATAHAFFDGLLPEGDARRIVAYDLGLDERDVLGLLAALGRDCAGALVLLPPDETPATDAEPERIDAAAIGQRLRSLRFHPLGIDDRVRLSLAGMQEKLLLARVDAEWASPVDGAPSTHILKPAHPLLPDAIVNEALCLRLASILGVAAAPAWIETFDGVSALVIERYDRVMGGDGRTVVRLHQEDLCQALGIDSQRKYEELGGPTLARCADVVRRWGTPGELERLLDAVAISVLVGNADAHAKNFALVHGVDGAVGLAPVYDVMSTVHYPRVDDVAGMRVNGVRSISATTRSDLVEEAVAWGIGREQAAERTARLFESAVEALTCAAVDVGAPDELVETLRARIRAIDTSR
jgi:serine/threonine-protein kinase HipA